MALQDKCSVGEVLEYVNYLVKSVIKYDQEYRKAMQTVGVDNTYLMQLFLRNEGMCITTSLNIPNPRTLKGKRLGSTPTQEMRSA